MGLPVQLYKAGQRGSNTQISGAAIDGLLSKRTYSYDVANATAATAVTESVIAHVRRGGIVRNISLNAPIAVAQDAANIATFTIAKRTGAGAAQTIASISTVTVTGVALVAFVPLEIAKSFFTAANVVLADGDVLTLAIAKGGTGVALSAATSTLNVSVDVEED